MKRMKREGMEEKGMEEKGLEEKGLEAKRIPVSRRIWGLLVFALGMLWAVGGIFGIGQLQWQGWLYLLCGVVLLRLGWNLIRPVQK